MTSSTLDKPQVGDLVMSYDGEIGIISLIETDKFMCPYFVRWFSGYLTGYSTAHKLREIKAWTINLTLFS
jgi:hypothetical protein